MKLLYISAHVPSMLIPQAGHKTSYKNLENLSKRFSVDAIFFSNKMENKYIEKTDYKKLNINIIKIKYLSFINKLVNILRNPSVPIKYGSRLDNEIIRFINKIDEKYDVIFFEFSHSASILKKLNKKFKKTIVSIHDIYSNYQSSEIFKKLLFSRSNKYELNLFTEFSEIWVQSKNDLNFLSKYARIEKVILMEPFFNKYTTNYKRQRVYGKHTKKNLLFWGAMNRPENYKSILSFWKNNSNFLIENNFFIFVVGSSPPEEMVKEKNKNFIVTGFVNNPAPYFRKSHLGIAPLLSGAGIKVKVLEMLHTGLDVIGTPVACDSIDSDKLINCEIINFKKELIDYFKL